MKFMKQAGIVREPGHTTDTQAETMSITGPGFTYSISWCAVLKKDQDNLQRVRANNRSLHGVT